MDLYRQPYRWQDTNLNPELVQVLKESPKTLSIRVADSYTVRVSKTVPRIMQEYGAVAYSSDGPLFTSREDTLKYMLSRAEQNHAAAQQRVVETERRLSALRAYIESEAD